MEYKRKGDEYTTTDHNRFVDAHKRSKITAAQGSGIIVNNDSPSGITLSLSSAITFPPVLVKCTAANTPSAGLHTFKKCDLDGVILTGDDEVIYTSCRLIGDFEKTWPMSTTEDSESYGEFFVYEGQNTVRLLGMFAYYIRGDEV